MKKVLNNVIISLTVISLLIVICGLVLVPITGSKAYYKKQFKKNNTTENISYYYRDLDNNVKYMEYTKEDLMVITQSIIDYLLHGKESMQVVVHKEDGDYEVFSNQALKHMADVKDLYHQGIVLCVICGIILIGCITYIVIFRDEVLPIMFKTSLITVGVILLLFAALGIYMLLDWNNAFTMFHHVIFPDERFNDAFFGYKSNYEELYYINNQTLINILTDSVFMDAGIITIVAVTVILLSYLTGSFFLSKKTKQNSSKSI